MKNWIKYLWHKYIKRDGMKLITSYKLFVGDVIQFSRGDEKSLILRRIKTKYQDFEYYVIPYKIRKMKDYVIQQLNNGELIYREGVWR